MPRAALGEELADPADQEVLGEVVVALDQGDPLAVGALDDEGPVVEPGLHAVARALERRVVEGVDVAVGGQARRRRAPSRCTGPDPAPTRQLASTTATPTRRPVSSGRSGLASATAGPGQRRSTAPWPPAPSHGHGRPPAPPFPPPLPWPPPVPLPWPAPLPLPRPGPPTSLGGGPGCSAARGDGEQRRAHHVGVRLADVRRRGRRHRELPLLGVDLGERRRACRRRRCRCRAVTK